jgi:hypothetical protein
VRKLHFVKDLHVELDSLHAKTEQQRSELHRRIRAPLHARRA